MNKYYIAADCGGTKIDLLAFDEGGQAAARLIYPGGVNAKITPPEVIKANLKSAYESLKASLPDAEFISACGYFMHNQTLFTELTGIPSVEYDEGILGLYAAGIKGDGVLILCGTGADAYVIKGGKTVDIIGGYGAVLGDEGSGFSIGQAGINAAIRAYEGRGPKTLLTEMLTEKYPAESFRQTVYGIYRAAQPQREVASFCFECERAAELGDTVALEIFKVAADTLCSFAYSAYNRYFPDKSAPFTFSGGAIRNDLNRAAPLMANLILEKLAEFGAVNYVKPDKPPIYGAVEYFISLK